MDIITRVLRESVNEFLINERNDRKKGVYIDHELQNKKDPYVSKEEAENMRKALSSDMINVAKVARIIYPHLTPEGAQSELQKKIDGQDANGKKYHFRRSEAARIRAAISRLQSNIKEVE